VNTEYGWYIWDFVSGPKARVIGSEMIKFRSELAYLVEEVGIGDAAGALIIHHGQTTFHAFDFYKYLC
jgi:hypothetical protein